MPGHNFPRNTGDTRTGGRYDYRHQKVRAAAARQHNPSDPCSRCGHALGPMGAWLHYDHTDDGLDYLGFSHGSRPCPTCGRRCNLHAGAVEGNRRQRDTTPTGCRHTRNW